jgi:hypothetical protein
MNKNISKPVRSQPARLPVFFILGALLVVVAACTPGSSVSPSNSGQTTSAAPAAPAVPAGARDVNAMNACVLFPGAAVASALNTTLADPNNPGAGIATTCTYFLLPAGAGSGSGQLYNLFLYVPDLYKPSLSAIENAQPVAGLGDQAMLGTRVGTGSADVMVLKSGDIFIEVNGPDAGMVQKLAEYVLTHLP